MNKSRRELFGYSNVIFRDKRWAIKKSIVRETNEPAYCKESGSALSRPINITTEKKTTVYSSAGGR